MSVIVKPKNLPGLLLAALLLLLAAPSGRSSQKNWDTRHREYRIVKVNPDDEESTERRVLKITGFTTWVEEPADQPGLLYIHRQERTDEGDQMNWKFTVKASDLKLIRSDRTTTTRAGKPLEQVAEFYDNAVTPYPPNTFHFNMLPIVLQRMDFTPGTVKPFSFVFSPTFPPWNATVTAVGEETITVPAGTFDCYKLELEYSTDNLPGFMKILPDYLLKKIMSGYYLWMDKQAPHPMIRFQGKLEGLGSPEKAQELVKVE